MKSLLVGATGFVGSNISRHATFSAYANSRNFTGFAGEHFDLVIFSAAPAVKWWANANPQSDAEIIERLLVTLKRITAERFVLISTVDVYPSPFKVDELTAIDRGSGMPYGRHRKWLEDEVREAFPVHNIIRLPGLFGPGLRKNVLFDLVHKNQLERINLDSRFQWYPLERIWDDIQRVIFSDLSVVNLATEPVATRDVLARFFAALDVGDDPVPAASYDVRTAHSESLGGTSGIYLLGAEQIFSAIQSWLQYPEYAHV